MSDVFPVDLHFAGLRNVCAGNAVQKRTLSRPVASDDGAEIAVIQRKRQINERFFSFCVPLKKVLLIFDIFNMISPPFPY